MTLDIKIGSVGQVGGGTGPRPGMRREPVEARVLSVRRARRHETTAGKTRSRRRVPSGESRDPLNASVITLLVPDGSHLPRDLASGSYRALLRFLRR